MEEEKKPKSKFARVTDVLFIFFTIVSLITIILGFCGLIPTIIIDCMSVFYHLLIAAYFFMRGQKGFAILWLVVGVLDLVSLFL